MFISHLVSYSKNLKVERQAFNHTYFEYYKRRECNLIRKRYENLNHQNNYDYSYTILSLTFFFIVVGRKEFESSFKVPVNIFQKQL